MRQLSKNHKDEIQRFTSIDYDKLMQLTYLYEFDRAYQCPMWGYPTEEAYYRDASSVDSLLAVRIPTLCINAVDDPIAHHEALPYGEARQNPYTVLCTTSLGGHLGWFEIGGGRWHAKPVGFSLSSRHCRSNHFHRLNIMPKSLEADHNWRILRIGLQLP